LLARIVAAVALFYDTLLFVLTDILLTVELWNLVWML